MDENRIERKSKREYKWMKIENTSGRKSKREYKWMKIENRIENRKYNSMKIENRIENRKYNSMKSALLGHRNNSLVLVMLLCNICGTKHTCQAACLLVHFKLMHPPPGSALGMLDPEDHVLGPTFQPSEL